MTTIPFREILTTDIAWRSTSPVLVTVPLSIAQTRSFNEKLPKLAHALINNGWTYKLRFGADEMEQYVSGIELTYEQKRTTNVKTK